MKAPTDRKPKAHSVEEVQLRADALDERRRAQITRQTGIISRLVRYMEFVKSTGQDEAFSAWLAATEADEAQPAPSRRRA